MGYISSFGAKASSARWLKFIGSAAVLAFITLASFGTLAVTTVPGMILNGIPYCLSTTAGAAPTNKPLNIAASVTGAVQMVVFTVANIVYLGYNVFSAFCATAEICVTLEAARVEEIEINTLGRIASAEVEANARLFRRSITLQRREGINWIAMRSDSDVATTWKSINRIYGDNEITRTVGIALITARKTARKISLLAMQRLLNESSSDILDYVLTLPDSLDESLLTDLFMSLSRGSEVLSGTTASENLSTIFSNHVDLFVLQSTNKVVLAKWLSGSFSNFCSSHARRYVWIK